MKNFTLPGTDLHASDVVLGLMRISSLSDDEIRTLVGSARDAGINFFDHADVYGTQAHGCEARFGDAVTFTATERETKGAITAGALGICQGGRAALISLAGWREYAFFFSATRALDLAVQPGEQQRAQRLQREHC